MKKLTPEEIIEQYIKTGLIWEETTLNGDYKTSNKQGKIINKIFKMLEADIELARITLPQLFKNENVVTRTEVAAQCISLNIYINESKKY